MEQNEQDYGYEEPTAQNENNINYEQPYNEAFKIESD